MKAGLYRDIVSEKRLEEFMQEPYTGNQARKKIQEDMGLSADPGLYYIEQLFQIDDSQNSPRSETRYWIPRMNYWEIIRELSDKMKSESPEKLTMYGTA